MANSRNVPGVWSVTVDVDSITHQVGPNQVTVNSSHSFRIHNVSGDEHDFRIHYSIDLYEAVDEDEDGNVNTWERKGFEDIDKTFPDIPNNAVRTHLDAAKEPSPGIDYLLAAACNKVSGRLYRAEAYTLITPPHGDDPDFEGSIQCTKHLAQFRA